MGAVQKCANHYPTIYIYCTEVHLSFCNFYMNENLKTLKVQVNGAHRCPTAIWAAVNFKTRARRRTVTSCKLLLMLQSGSQFVAAFSKLRERPPMPTMITSPLAFTLNGARVCRSNYILSQHSPNCGNDHQSRPWSRPLWHSVWTEPASLSPFCPSGSH